MWIIALGLDLLIVGVAIWLGVWAVRKTFYPWQRKQKGLVHLKEKEWNIIEGSESRDKRGLW